MLFILKITVYCISMEVIAVDKKIEQKFEFFRLFYSVNKN